MPSSAASPLPKAIRAAQGLQEECQLFLNGFVESLGVTWRWDRRDPLAPCSATAGSRLPQSTAGPLASPSRRVREAATADSASRGGEAHTSTCGSPTPTPAAAAAESTNPSSTNGDGEALEGAASDVSTDECASSLSMATLHVDMMPPWSLVEHDPKLWVLLRKNLLANVALAALTLVYMLLSSRLAAPAPPTAHRVAASWTNATQTDTQQPSPNAAAAAQRAHDAGARSYLSSLLLFWWLRLFVWALKYMGQWPFYTILQIVGLVWFSQLYRETWLVRKGWVLRGTRLREAAAVEAGRGRGGGTPRPPADGGTASSSSYTASSSYSSPPPEPRDSAAVRPWLAPIPLRKGRLSPLSTQPSRPPDASQLTLFLCAASEMRGVVVGYGKHVLSLLLRMLRHKGPTAPLQGWVIGDAAAAAAAAAGATGARRPSGGTSPLSHSPPAPPSPTPPSSSPDIFDILTQQLQAVSEIMFKALATMSFAIFASCLERLPLVGRLLSLLLNAQLFAFYVFDYRYASQQQPDSVHQRGSALMYQLHHFEQCWAYYAGYGIGSALVSSLLTQYAGVVVSVCATSVLYSWQVVWSGFAVPLPSSRRLPIFSLWFYAVDMVQKRFALLWRSVVIVALLYIPYECVRYVHG